MRVAMIWQHTEPRSLDEERVRIPSEVLIFLIYLIWLSLVFGNQRSTAVASRLNMVFMRIVFVCEFPATCEGRRVLKRITLNDINL